MPFDGLTVSFAVKICILSDLWLIAIKVGLTYVVASEIRYARVVALTLCYELVSLSWTNSQHVTSGKDMPGNVFDGVATFA